VAAANGQTCPLQWLPGDGVAGVNGPVNVAIAWDPDGSGPAPEGLVVGGSFSVAEKVLAKSIACWDPATSTWSTLGAGVNGSVNALAVLDGKLYAGGSFTAAGAVSANGIACWDPATSTWSPLGLGVRTKTYQAGVVSALTALNGKLYAGGTFDRAGTVSAKNVACWDPATSTWSAMGVGLDTVASSSVKAFAVLDNKLYAGGYFAGPSCIACWDPATSTWSALGWGADGEVCALTVLENKLYVGGKFSTAGQIASPRVACWDPATSTWASLGTGIDSTPFDSRAVYALAAFGGKGVCRR
jgi:hypothetical protein